MHAMKKLALSAKFAMTARMLQNTAFQNKTYYYYFFKNIFSVCVFY
jgi:hypothetical protein